MMWKQTELDVAINQNSIVSVVTFRYTVDLYLLTVN